MSDMLTIDTQRVGGSHVLQLAGVIDERADFSQSTLPRGKVVVDLGGVQAINSFGVRGWLNFKNSLLESCESVEIARLSPAMARQASMIESFLGGMNVRSFFTPWLCVDCEHAALILHAANDEVPTTASCPECNSSMEFDDVRESYLAFLSVD